MEEKNIRKYAELMRELGLTALEINEKDGNVRMERCGAAQPILNLKPEAEEKQTFTETAEKEQSEKKIAAGKLVEVKSPMIGVFYSAPAENAVPYVRLGDRVKKGDVLCIIEAMKLMNEITSEEDGKIVEICTGNKQIVDFGHVLFRIEKED